MKSSIKNHTKFNEMKRNDQLLRHQIR